MRYFVLVLTTCGLAVCAATLPAQSRTDSLALIRAMTDIIAQEAAENGGHHATFVIADSAPSGWSRAIATRLRVKHKGLIGPPGPHVLQLSLGNVSFSRDTARVPIRWTRCTGRETRLNWWKHVETFVFIRSRAGWRTERKEVTFADGHCA